jgi:hypothetical protein
MGRVLCLAALGRGDISEHVVKGHFKYRVVIFFDVEASHGTFSSEVRVVLQGVYAIVFC